jgi:hypothetical protein
VCVEREGARKRDMYVYVFMRGSTNMDMNTQSISYYLVGYEASIIYLPITSHQIASQVL